MHAARQEHNNNRHLDPIKSVSESQKYRTSCAKANGMGAVCGFLRWKAGTRSNAGLIGVFAGVGGALKVAAKRKNLNEISFLPVQLMRREIRSERRFFERVFPIVSSGVLVYSILFLCVVYNVFVLSFSELFTVFVVFLKCTYYFSFSTKCDSRRKIAALQ